MKISDSHISLTGKARFTTQAPLTFNHTLNHYETGMCGCSMVVWEHDEKCKKERKRGKEGRMNTRH